MMKTRIKRLIALSLVFAFVLGITPNWQSMVFAEADSVSVTATYNNLTDTDSVTLTDTSSVIFTITVTQDTSTSTSNKISIALPIGVGLVSAPGINAVDTNGTITAKDYLSGSEANYFDGTPTWNATGAVDGVNTLNGTLEYTLQNVSNAEFSILAVINPEFVPVGYDAVTTVMGDVTVTMTNASTDATVISDSIEVRATSQASGLAITSFTSEQYFDNTSLNTFENANYLSSDGTSIHSFAFKASINRSVTGANYDIPVYAHSFTLTYPENAVITYNTVSVVYAEVEGTKKDNGDGTVSVTVEAMNAVSIESVHSCSLGTIDYSKCYDENTTAGTTFTVTASNLSFTVRSYDVDTKQFEQVTITPPTRMH